MSKYHTLNIGVHRQDEGADLKPSTLGEFWPHNVSPPEELAYVKGEEDTIVAFSSLGWSQPTIQRMCITLRQDCIAAMSDTGGKLIGPNTAPYGSFDRARFVCLVEAQELSELPEAQVGPRVVTAHTFDQLAALLRDAHQRQIEAEERVAYAIRQRQDAEAEHIEAKEAFDEYVQEAQEL